MPRFFCPLDLTAEALIELPAGAARHVQVLRMQPGQPLELFNGQGGNWQAEIVAMTRSSVSARILSHDASERELATPLHIAISAAEQCGRTRGPTVAPVLSLPYWLSQRDRAQAAFVLSPPHAGSSPPLLQAVAPGLAAVFLIGPEGGLSEKEITLALDAGCKPCHLGARVLRAETAPLAILAALALRELS